VNYTGAGEKNILQLLAENGDVIREVSVSGNSSVTFSYVNPAVYQLKFINDTNQNAKWNTGDYLRHLQPEVTRFYPDKVVVRGNWDVDVAWDLAR
jgi:hypothetical protein